MKERRGRSHHKKKPGKIPSLPVAAPDVPDIVANDAYALEAWNRLKKDFLALRVLSKKDWAALAALCLAWSLLKKAKEAVDKHGVIIERKRKGKMEVVSNPAVAVYNKALSTINRYASEFGLTPASMTRVREVVGDENTGNAPAKDAPEDADTFLFGRTGTGGGKILPMRRK